MKLKIISAGIYTGSGGEVLVGGTVEGDVANEDGTLWYEALGSELIAIGANPKDWDADFKYAFRPDQIEVVDHAVGEG